MYGLLWRSLPGRWPVRVLEMLVLAVAAVALLFYVVFPWADPKLPLNDNTVDSPSSVVTAPPGTGTGTGTGTSPRYGPSAGPTATGTASPTGSSPTSTATGGVLPGD